MSFVSNAALLVSLRRGAGAGESASDVVAKRALSDAKAEASAGSNAGNASAAARGAGAAIPAEAWASLQSGDLAALTANLRAAGFPAEVVRAIVAKRVNDLFAERRKAITGSDEPRPFWDTKRNRYSSERFAKLRPLMKEQQQMLKDLLGADAVGDEGDMYQRRRFGFLPSEKSELAAKIESDYGEMASDLYRESSSARLPDDRDKLALIEKEKRADLVALLTPEELEQYDFHLSSTGQSMRQQLAGFQPTEQEFRDIFALRRVFDERFNGMYGMPDPAVMQQRQGAEKDLNAQLKSVLGNERFAEYERSLDQGYNAASQIADHFKLPAENAVAVFNLQKAAQEAQNAIQSDQSQSQEQRREALSALAAETKGRLTSLLTADGVVAYRQTGGFWLRNLESMSMQRPRPPAAPPAGG